MIGVAVQVWQATFVEVCQLYLEEYMDYLRSEQWNLLEICYCSACTEALSMLRGGRYNSPTLVSRGLQERPVKNSAQKIQNTLTSRGRNIWKCRSPGVLPKVKGVRLLTPPVPVFSPPKRQRTEFLLDWHRELVVNWSSDPESRLTEWYKRLKDSSLKANDCKYHK